MSAALAFAACGGATVAVGGSNTTASAPPASLARVVGQMMVVRIPGRIPSASFLARIRAGEIGGVVLFAENFGPAGPGALVRQLQAAVRQGGNPPLLIAIDQEGGIVKRLPGAPTLAPPMMLTPQIARAQGVATARNLAHYGINVDLAPVLDVGRGGFITSRTFGHAPATVAVRATAFAQGLIAGSVIPTGKHFPGLGYATTTTDASAVVVHASRAAVLADLRPFRSAVAGGVPLIMVGTATYPSLGVRVPAALSPAVVEGLLRKSLGFRGVVMTDALWTGAVTKYNSVPGAAVQAIAGGVDMVLVAGTTSRSAEAMDKAAFTAVLNAARDKRLAPATITAAYQRIVALKRRLLTPKLS